MANIGEVAAALDVALDGRAATVIVDLSSVDFLDSSMLNLLAQALPRMQADGRKLLLVRPPAGVWRVFEIAKLDRFFTSVESLETALFRASV